MCMNNPNFESKIKELKELKNMQSELENEISALEDEIKAAMGAETEMISGPFRVTWKAVTSSRLDSTALKKSLPDIAAQFMKTTTTRRFIVA